MIWGLIALSFIGAIWASAEPARAGTEIQVAQDVIATVLDTIERRIIDDYYARNYHEWEQGEGKGKKKGKHKGLPPGIAKKGTLPPGLYMQLVRNGSLPPGLQREPLPPDLLSLLPARPIGQQYYIADDRVLLVEAATNLILDVLTVTAAED